MLKTWKNVRYMKFLIFTSDRGVNLFIRGKLKQKKNPNNNNVDRPFD